MCIAHHERKPNWPLGIEILATHVYLSVEEGRGAHRRPSKPTATTVIALPM